MPPGPRLVTDDVLPLKFGPGANGRDTVFCLRVRQQVRLRPKAFSLADRFDPDSVRTTADDRHAVAATASDFERIPLRGGGHPQPEPRPGEVGARVDQAGEASLALARFQDRGVAGP